MLIVLPQVVTGSQGRSGRFPKPDCHDMAAVLVVGLEDANVASSQNR